MTATMEDTEVAKGTKKTEIEGVEKLSEGTAAGFKTTTVRLPNELFEEMNIYAAAMGGNLTSFIQDAVEMKIDSVAGDPKVAKAAKRQLAHYIKMAQRIEDRAAANGTSDG